MLRLRVQPAQGDPFDLPLDREEIVVGRASDCDLTVEDRYMSRHHARVFKRDGDWWLEDLGSRNGTLLNGEALSDARKIAAGDEVALSGSALSLIDTDAPVVADLATTSVPPDHTVFRQASELLESQVSLPPTSMETVPELRSYASRLQILNEVHQVLARSETLEELLSSLLEHAFELLSPEEAVAVLRQPDGSYERAARQALPEVKEEHPVSETLVREVAEKGMAALVLDAAQDERFAAAESIMVTGMRSLIAAPFNDADGPLGLIALSSRLSQRQFEEADMELLTSLAAVAALRMRNLALAAEAEERRRLAREIELARQIQLGLLPDELPELPNFDVYGGTEPSQGVSGDFFEVIRHSATRCSVAVIDVSGKGISASLLTASIEALLAGALESSVSPKEICRQVSGLLLERTPAAKYATALLAALDPETGRMTYANAGHNPGLLVRADGTIEQLSPSGPPIGLIPEAKFEERAVDLAPSDLVVLYTDGITEATNLSEDEFGTDRLAGVCSEHRQRPLEELAEAIDAAVTAFVEGVPFADDRTLVLLRRQADS